MTRTLKFSSANLSYTDPSEDCYIDPSDPLNAYLGQAVIGTLTPAAEQHFQQRKLAQKQGIHPGSPAWHAMTQTTHSGQKRFK